jgi:hypothetical protein
MPPAPLASGVDGSGVRLAGRVLFVFLAVLPLIISSSLSTFLVFIAIKLHYRE